MGKSGGKAQISEFRMSLHYSFCSGPVDEITGLYIDKKPMWEGTASESSVLTINQPKLFGGKKKEGGPVGQAYLLFGEDDQTIPSFLASKMGETEETCPASRGLTTIFFTGAPTSSTPPTGSLILRALWNAAQQAGGFLWGTNNPYLKPVSARMFRAPKGLSPELATISKTVNGKTYRAANPAHMLYEIKTKILGESPLTIDTESFEAAAQTLYNEEFGLAMRWSRQSPVEDIEADIIDHIQAVIYEDLSTGLTTIKLLRDDYDIETVPEINPDNATITDFQRRALGETVNEIVGTWTNPDNEEPSQITLQNPTNVSNQGGQVVSDGRDFHGVRWASLCAELVQRELRAASAPLVSCKADLDRTFWDKAYPGAVLKMPWVIDGINLTFYMRVMNVDFGKPGASTMKVTLLEDLWSLDRVDYGAPTSSWVDPSSAPDPVTDYLLFTLPALLAGKVAILDGAEYPEVGAGVLAAPPSDDSQNVELYGWATPATGDPDFTDLGWRSLCSRMETSTALDAEAITDLYEFPSDATKLGPVANGYVFIGEGADDEIEIALIEGKTEDEDGWVLRRGVLDTVPRDWPVGTPMWFVSPTARIADDTTIRAAGETLRWKLLDKTSLGTYDLDDADEINFQLTDRPYLPLRPADVAVNGTTFGSRNVSADTNIIVTWATRNRLLEVDQVLDWEAAPVVPEYRQRTVVTIRNVSDDAIILQWLGLWVENTLTFPKTYLTRFNEVWVEVSSERDGFDSLQFHRVKLTGLPNNPSGEAPPTLPAPSEPPAPSAAPGSGVYTATGSYTAGADGTRVPIIVVAGTADDETASAVVIEIRRNGDTPRARTTVTIPESGTIRSELRGVAPATLYNVQVAYITPLGLSAFRTLADVTTGALIAGDTSNVGGTPSTDVLDDINNNAWSLMQTALGRVEIDEIIRRADLLDLRPAAFVLAKRITDEALARVEAVSDEAEARAAAILAEALARGAAITAESLIRQGVEESLAASIVTLTASVATDYGTLAAAIEDVESVLTTAISAEATARQLLATQMRGSDTGTDAGVVSSGLIYSLRQIMTTADGTLASDIELVQANLDDEVSDREAAILIEYTARVDGDEAEAEARETLAVQMRGDYAGTDIEVVTEGLLHSARTTWVAADAALAEAITLVSAGVGIQFDSGQSWYFDSTVEGWDGNGTPTASGGWLRPANHGSAPYVYSPDDLGLDGLKYGQVLARVEKHGTPTFAGWLYWKNTGDTTWDTSRRVALDEPAWDPNDSGVISVFPGWPGTVKQIRIDLSAVQDGTDYYRIDWVGIGRPSPGASTASVLQEASTRADAISAEATSRETLSVVLTGETDPTGLTLDDLTSGLVFEEKTVRVTATTGLASDIDALSLTVDGHDISIVAQSLAIIDINGRLAGSWGITLDVDGRVSGLLLHTEAGGSDTTSYFDILADKFRVFNGTSDTPVFEVSGGNVYISGDIVRTDSLVPDAAIKPTAHQSVGTSVTAPSRGTVSGHALLKSMDFVVDRDDSKFEIIVSFDYDSDNSNVTYCWLKIGTVAPTWATGGGSADMTNADKLFLVSAYDGPATKVFEFTGLAVGTNTLEVHVGSTGSGSHSNDLIDPFFSVKEFKKPS